MAVTVASGGDSNVEGLRVFVCLIFFSSESV